MLFVGPTEGEIARLLQQEQCGVAVAASDGQILAATIAAWQADPALRTQLGRNARSAYERHFTFANALARWEEILRQAAGP